MLLTACTGGTFLHEYHDVDLWGWNADDTVTFHLPVITRGGKVEAEVGVRFTNSYRYKDLLLLGIVERDDEVVRTDTVRVNIFRENGTDTGEGFPYITTEQRAVTFEVDSGHVYRYRIVHLMSPGPTKGICGIGLKLREE
jgi:gliding motility-associated lipoprotein GldH